MSNTYFQFKQFTVHQDKTAMKVCTDACLFGALIPNCEGKVLDIGTGTGLLPLMFAQKNTEAIIDCVEIDEAAAEQASQNISASPCANRINVFNTDVKQFNQGKQYQAIISNPPFFKNDLISPHKGKNKAKHDSSLTLSQLIKIVNQHLTQEGFFAVLLPYHRVEAFISEAEKAELYLNKQILVKQTPKHPFFRGIIIFKKIKAKPSCQEITIKEADGNYSTTFIEALKDYYLYL